MMDFIISRVHDARFLSMLFAAIAAGATVLTLAMPLIAGDALPKRMKSVALEREKIRQRERERLARGEKVVLRASPKQYMQQAVERFNLKKWVGQEEAREKLIQAGYRGEAPYVAYLFFRMVTPVISVTFGTIYVFGILEINQPTIVKVGFCIFAAYVGMQLPWLFLKNRITKRQISIRRAFPDALDLLLICVESGMSIEAAFKRVSEEIGSQSIRWRKNSRSPLPNCPICRIVGRPMRTSPGAPIWKACARFASRSSKPNATARRSGKPCAFSRRKIATCAWPKPRRRRPRCRPSSPCR